MIPWASEKNAYSISVGRNILYICYAHLNYVLAEVSFLIFRLNSLYIGETGILKPPNVIVLVPVWIYYAQ